MSDVRRDDLLLPGQSRPIARFLVQQRPYVVTIAVLLTGLFVAAGALSRSYLIGRLIDPITHNDVNYIIDGISRVLYMQVNGFWSEVSHLYYYPMHAPLEGYLAAFGFYLFGFHNWAPYLANIVLVWVILTICARLLRGYPDVVVIGGLLMVAGIPLSLTTIDEFSPELALGLFSALGVLLFVPISTLDRQLPLRAASGFFLGLGMLWKPSSLIFVPLVVLACLGVSFIRDVIYAGKWRQWVAWRTAIGHGVLQMFLSLWLPALYILPNFTEYKNYFVNALFNAANVKAFGYVVGFKENVLYYLTGYAGEYMFGNFLWVYLILIAAGLLAASYRNNINYLNRQFYLSVLAVFMWLMPTASIAKNALFGAPFGFTIVFMMVMALGEIYEVIRGAAGSVTVAGIGVFFLLSGNSHLEYSNTPGFNWERPDAHILRKMWPKTQTRLRTVMLDNSPNYYGRFVYMTNSSYFFTPVLWYSFLKQDPTLDWRFAALWQDSDPQVHLKYIQETKADFVIAGEKGNGLTYGPSMEAGATAAENTVLKAMWDDPDYMPLDRFYGPTGRTITVFQRSVAYAGWSELGGLAQPEGTARAWVSTDTVSHLDAYAPDPIDGTLSFMANGTPGETIEIAVDGRPLTTATFDAAGNATLARKFSLGRGDNDIVFRYSMPKPVTFKRLVVSRQIDRDQ